MDSIKNYKDVCNRVVRLATTKFTKELYTELNKYLAYTTTIDEFILKLSNFQFNDNKYFEVQNDKTEIINDSTFGTITITGDKFEYPTPSNKFQRIDIFEYNGGKKEAFWVAKIQNFYHFVSLSKTDNNGNYASFKVTDEQFGTSILNYFGVATSIIRVYSVRLKVNLVINVPISGLNLIKEFESCHLNAYPDPLTGDLPITIGWGSIHKADRTPFYLGESITQSEADELLISQCKKEYLPELNTIPFWGEMSDGKRGALLSFAYNLGANFYGNKKFATITKRLKNKQWDLVPSALYLYRNPGSNVEIGLARRRKSEGKSWNNS